MKAGEVRVVEPYVTAGGTGPGAGERCLVRSAEEQVIQSAVGHWCGMY